MGRQPLILGLLLLVGCEEDQGDLPWFDGPTGAVVLDPSEGGPFDEPVAFVANARSGTIVPIDVKHVTLLTDQPGAPFLMPRPVATGDERRLDQIAVLATEEGDVTLYAADLAFGTLVEAPYLKGGGDFPERVEVSASDAVFVDADGSGDAPSLGEIEVRTGYTTSEDWSVEYNGERWWVFGSRSGKQTTAPVSGEAWCSDRRELCFTLSGAASAGDRFELSTDAGVVEHELGGTILSLARVPGEPLLAAGIWYAELDQGQLVVFDPAAGEVRGRVTLPEGAQPWRISFHEGLAYVGDAQRSAAYVVGLDTADPAASPVEEIALPAPVSALAVVDTSTGPRLFVGLFGLDRVDVYDLAAGAWVDVNILDDEVAGIYARSEVVGLAASTEPVRLQLETSWGARLESPVVVMTTAAGELQMFDAETGCLVTEEEGPTLDVDSTGDTVAFSDVGATSDPAFLVDDATGWAVAVNPCGGVARSETWRVRYDQAEGGWWVEGSRSEEQEAMAYEESRYVSDQGEVSFTILLGQDPPTSGDTFAFAVDDGILTIDEIISVDGSSTPLDLPAAPILFQTENGPTGGGWDVLDRRTYALVPVRNANLVMRARLSSWDVEVVWR